MRISDWCSDVCSSYLLCSWIPDQVRDDDKISFPPPTREQRMIFWRVKPLDAILATADKKPLHRSLGAFQLTHLGIGAVIGTGLSVLTADAAQKAGPGNTLPFLLAGFVCGGAALCISERL